MKYCKKCAIPNTRPGEWGQKLGLFDEDGICLACRNYERRKTIDWDARFEELKSLVNKFKRTDGYYDCVIPVSGGKDSHYLVYMMKEVLGMNPLLVNVSDPFTHTEAGEKNLHNISNTFNCDIIQFRISENVFRRAVRSNFEEFGHPLILVEQAIYIIPLGIASRMMIPLLVQGEDPNVEYGTLADEEPTLTRHYANILRPFDIEFWLSRGFETKELNCLNLPTNLNDVHAIPLSYYESWNGVHHMEVAKRYGFRDLSHEWIREGAFENYDQIDSIGWIMALWLKFPKFGFSRATDIACRWIREGRITRNEAIELINKYDPVLDQKVLDDFLNFTGYSVREFWDIVERFWNKDIFEKKDGLWIRRPEYVLK